MCKKFALQFGLLGQLKLGSTVLKANLLVNVNKSNAKLGLALERIYDAKLAKVRHCLL